MVQFTIPLDSLKLHEKCASDFISQVGKQVTLFYPPLLTKCPNCLDGHAYNGTGPIIFVINSICPYCNGENFIKGDSTTDIITVMLYFDPRDFIKYQDFKLNIDDAVCQMRGNMGDLPKVQRADYLVLHKGIEGLGDIKYKKASQFIPYGVRLQSEFLMMLHRGV